MTDKTIIKIASGTVLVTALSAVIFIAHLLGLIPTGPFWESLFATFLSVVAILIIVAFLAPAYWRYVSRPILKCFPDDDAMLTRYLDNRLKSTIIPIIRNEGARTVRSYHWHFVIPRELNAVVQDKQGRLIGAKKIGKFDYVNGLVENQPIFPKSELNLPIRIAVEASDERPAWRIKYAINTEYGQYPREMELHRRVDESSFADCAEFEIKADIAKKNSVETEPSVVQPD